MSEIAKLKIWEGNKRRTLGDLFEIEQDKNIVSEDATIRICGDLSRVRRIGAKMSMGKIIVEGNVGMHLGEEMEGGVISVTGNAGSWAGCMMSDGSIEIGGDVGDYVGAAYRGSNQGMSGGTLTIHGNAGNEIGRFMSQGFIAVSGNVGQFAGIHMKKGTILIQGNSQARAGAQMMGGKIVICGSIPSILPIFGIESIRPKLKIKGEAIDGPFYMFIGDLAENGKGKLYVSKDQNEHLSFYKGFL